MPSLKSKIESMLLVTNYPLTEKKLLELTQEKDKKKISEAVTELYNDYKQRSDSGIVLVKTDDSVQLVTAPDNAGVVAKFIKDETTGELSRASLETLTIIAYRSPITRAELETIRGVNCSVILRNLSIRGLVESVMDKKKMATTY
ncbi:MAG: SMC-Scp complex subunit ScpB, partial [Candidatus Levybacteria bacterium CG10_big_fil_rev_8_21_14_0_10_36_7]